MAEEPLGRLTDHLRRAMERHVSQEIREGMGAVSEGHYFGSRPRKRSQKKVPSAP